MPYEPWLPFRLLVIVVWMGMLAGGVGIAAVAYHIGSRHR